MPKMAAQAGRSMSYICCCGRKCGVDVYKIARPDGFLAVFVSVLKGCPVCGAYVVEMRRYTEFGRVSVVRARGEKARKLFSKIAPDLLRTPEYEKVSSVISTLNYNEFGIVKKCRSNLSRLSIGKFESLSFERGREFLRTLP